MHVIHDHWLVDRPRLLHRARFSKERFLVALCNVVFGLFEWGQVVLDWAQLRLLLVG